jgi:hypothetical protein
MVRMRHTSGLVAVAACSASAQQWTAIRLQPEGVLFSQVNAAGAGVQGGSFRSSSPLADLPVLWHGTSTSWTALASGAGTVGEVFGIWRGAQVGELSGHAVLWLGTPESRVDLQPLLLSEALAVRGNMQAGWVYYLPPGEEQAALWRGTSASYVDLHPPSAIRSFAYATDGVLQGGTVVWEPSTLGRATLWSGSAQSYADLGPPGMDSTIRGMVPGVQVGWTSAPGVGYRAAVWHGTLQSVRDFNGPLRGSRLFATTGSVHVGDGGSGTFAQAVINFGTPDAWIELHQFLAPGYSSFSGANAVYQDGPTIYVGGYAYGDASGAPEAFLWIGTAPCYANCDHSTTPPVLTVSDFTCFLNRFVAVDVYANCDQSTTPPPLTSSTSSAFSTASPQGVRDGFISAAHRYGWPGVMMARS